MTFIYTNHAIVALLRECVGPVVVADTYHATVASESLLYV
jgi:hypothetical protein